MFYWNKKKRKKERFEVTDGNIDTLIDIFMYRIEVEYKENGLIMILNTDTHIQDESIRKKLGMYACRLK